LTYKYCKDKQGIKLDSLGSNGVLLQSGDAVSLFNSLL